MKSLWIYDGDRTRSGDVQGKQSLKLQVPGFKFQVKDYDLDQLETWNLKPERRERPGTERSN